MRGRLGSLKMAGMTLYSAVSMSILSTSIRAWPSVAVMFLSVRSLPSLSAPMPIGWNLNSLEGGWESISLYTCRCTNDNIINIIIITIRYSRSVLDVLVLCVDSVIERVNIGIGVLRVHVQL